jgi:hypothetical protein
MTMTLPAARCAGARGSWSMISPAFLKLGTDRWRGLNRARRSSASVTGSPMTEGTVAPTGTAILNWTSAPRRTTVFAAGD